MALHYQSFIDRMRSCPIPFAYGAGSGTGKTTALRCALSLLGCEEFRFFHHLSPAKAMHLCSLTNIPLGLDDPDVRSKFSSLIVDLYNGAKSGTLTSGEIKPISTVVVTSNILPNDDQRYSIYFLSNHDRVFCFAKRYLSRCLLIKFDDTPLTMSTQQHLQLVQLLEKCSSCVGFCIALGSRFFEEGGIAEVDNDIKPWLSSKSCGALHPRVVLSYSILMWFMRQVYYHYNYVSNYL